MLSVGIAKLESVQTNPKISLCVNFSSKSLTKLGSVERSNIIKKLLGKFGRYVTRLVLPIHGDETYLLQDEYRLPNLVALCVQSSPQKNDRGKFRYPSQKKCRIFEDLLVAYGRTLLTLGVEGLWSINISGTKLNSLETVNLSVSSSGTLESLLNISGQFISTLELYRVIGNVKGELCHLPNFKHLSLDTRNMRFYDFVQRNTKNLESLVFYCDEPIKPSFPLRLREFEKLKLLEVNCPVINYAILQKCTQTLEYLYVPKEIFVNWNELNLRLPIGLPNLKDLCVPGSERWSIEMIKKNCTSLEYLIIFGYTELDAFLEGDEEMEDLSDEDDFHSFLNGIDDNDSNDEENDSNDEDNDSNVEDNDSHHEKNDSEDEENDSEDEENDSNDEDNDSNDEENDSNDEENDSNDEENVSNDEANDFNEYYYSDEEYDSYNGENDSIDSNDEQNDSNDEENDSNAEDIESMGLFNDHNEDPTEYCWPDLSTINCRFPKLKMLLLPGCTETSIVESLAPKCPSDVKIITDRKLVGEAVKARITKDYSYSTYWRMIHPSLLELFKFD